MAKKAKKSKISVVGIGIAAVIVVCLVLSIVGVCIDTWTTTEELLGKTIDMSFSDYSERAESIRDAKESASEWGIEIESDSLLQPMVAFGYIAVIAAAVVALLYVLKLFVKAGIFRFLTGGVGVLTFVAGIILIAITASFCNDSSLVVGAGAILTSVGAMGAGLAGATALFLKK